FPEVTEAVRQANLDLTAGTIKTQEEELIVRARSKAITASGMQDIPVRSSQTGMTIRLSDVAEITDRWADNPSRSFVNGAPAAIINISTTVEEDVFTAVETTKTYLADLEESQSEVVATVIQDFSQTLQERLDLLIKNGLIGALLILILLALFLHYRLAFWVAIGIPISFLSMFILFYAFGYTINAISLFGMIIVIGILVDDGVIVAENIYKYYEQGYDRIEAAKRGTFQVLPSIISAILTTVVIFSLFFFIEGSVGDIFSDISFVVITTLLVSLIEALFILPAHVAHSRALERGLKPNLLLRFSNRILKFLTYKVYSPILKFIIEHKFSSIALSIAGLILMIGFVLSGKVKTTFFPVIEQDNIIVRLEMPYGTRETITKEKLDEIVAAAKRVSTQKQESNNGKDLVDQVEVQLGPLANQGQVNILLQDATERTIRSFALVGIIRDEVGQLDGAESVIFTTDSPFGKPISISLSGDNMDDLRAVKASLKAGMAAMSDLKDVTDNDILGKKEVVIRLLPKADQLGISLGQIMQQVRSGFYGSEIQNLQVGGDEVKVWVRYKEGYRSNLDALENMRIRLAPGQEYPLSELADLEITRGPLAINHVDGFREIKIDSEISNDKVSVPDVTSKIQQDIIEPLLLQYRGVKAGFEGQSRESAKTARSAQRILPILLILTFAIIALVFRSATQTLAVLALIPFSIVGVILGHYIHGAQLGILSALGIIALVGVLVNDSLVYISTLNGKLKEGLKYKEALYKTGLERFRPILLTSVTTVAGLSPLILEKSFQAQFLIPMAISLAYGLAFATFLTWFLLPSILLYMSDVKFYFSWLWNGKRPVREQLEAALKEDKIET
ncbi:MAG: efflux RND transporter permease subunit, partial [Saprospiraceae bacterium]|nr:efflux RND transporter permease subunit [Saprospiraceae bacterium]